MPMKRCENDQHYYDPEKHQSCPYCGVSGLDIGTTRKKDPETAAMAVDSQAVDQNTDKTRRHDLPPKNRGRDGETIGIFKKKIGIQPVVGWLVCVEGPDRGRDFRIKPARNFIGRAEYMDVYIQGDTSISRENHAIISYDMKSQAFKVLPGDSHELVYLNDNSVDMPTALKPYDVIELGQTKLIFVPFCGESFQWTEKD